MKHRPSVWSSLLAVDHRVQFIDVGQWRTRVLEAGSGPPLILMHGTGGHLEAYAHNVAELASEFRVIAYDYPGHGYTTHASTDLELPAYVEHLDLLLKGLNIDRAHLSGESLGGWVAVKFAAKYPERVDRLILNTPGGTMSNPEVMSRIRELSQAAADDPTRTRVRARLEWLMADPASVSDELVDIRHGVYSREGFAKSMRCILCLQDEDIRARNLITDAELSGIGNPTMLIWTSDDPSGPVSAGREMAECMSDARFELIEGAGHWPQWEQPRIFNQLVSTFLRGDIK